MADSSPSELSVHAAAARKQREAAARECALRAELLALESRLVAAAHRTASAEARISALNDERRRALAAQRDKLLAEAAAQQKNLLSGEARRRDTAILANTEAAVREVKR